MVVDIKQRIGTDLYIQFEEGKLKYDISLFDDLTGIYVYATRFEKDTLDFYIVEADYSYSEEGGNNYINFVAGFPVDEFFTFKLLDVKPDFDRVTSIIDMEDINPTTLNAEFDNIRDYMYLIQEIVSKKALRYDADYSSTMLPKLNNGEFWIKTDTGFRATNFETLEAIIATAFNDFFGLIGGEDETYTFEGVTAISGDWFRTDIIGAVVDGIATQKGDFFGTYYVMTSGFVVIPTGETDDVGSPYVTNSYYYQSLTVGGGFSPIKPISGISKLVFKVIDGTLEGEPVQYALILNYPHTIGDGTVSSEYIKYFNSVLDMQGNLELGLNQRVDVNAELYKIVNVVQPIQLDNLLYAELLENEQVGTNVTNIGLNRDDIDSNATSLVPVGVVNAFVGAVAPTGWLICDGSTFSAITYPDLDTLLGGNILPDLRGEFIRGLDGGRGIDSGRGNLTSQADELESHLHGQPTHIHGQPTHTHTYSKGSTGGSGGTGSLDRGSTTGTTNAGGGDNTYAGGGDNTNSTGGTETRPRNIAMNYIIKAL